MNRQKSLIIGLLFLTIIFSILVSLLFTNISISTSQYQYQQNKTSIEQLIHKIDSLENIINTNFKNKKDTIIINIIPQQIKIYNK